MEYDYSKLNEQTIEAIKDIVVDSLTHQMTHSIPPQYEEIHNSIDQRKLTKNPHEIIFDINAYVFENNEKGEATGTKEICNKKFHIPVPIDKDYHTYMKTFFNHIEKCLITSIQRTNNE